MNSVVHVLSPGLSYKGEIVDIVPDSYVGGFTRMSAALEIAKSHPDLDICMVGGGNATPESFSPKSDKTRKMVDFLFQRGIEIERIRELPSLPCTMHNMVAIILSHLQEHIRGDAPRLRILTNEYHQPRAAALMQEAYGSILPRFPLPDVQWLNAEKILGISEEDLILACPEAYQARLDLEARGLADIATGAYIDACKGRYEAGIKNAFHGQTAAYSDFVGPLEAGITFEVLVNLYDYVPR